MAYIEIYWTVTEEPIKIGNYAKSCGFDLQILDKTLAEDDQWNWIEKKIQNNILKYLAEIWEKKEEERTSRFSSVKQGVYVITLANNLSIDYYGMPSQVIYIGRGQLRSRISSHLQDWIHDFTYSLQDISFEIWMTEVKVPGSKNAFKEVEADLLAYFYERYESYPIQNSKSGDVHEKRHDYNNEWNNPLRNPKDIQSGWSIKPLAQNPWFMELDE